MGEKNAATAKRGGEERKGEAGKKDDGPAIVLKFGVNCNRCAQEVVDAVSKLNGVKDVRVELTVTGTVDLETVKTTVAKLTHQKEVEIVSRRPKERQASEVLLMIPLHGDGCEQVIKDFKGVDAVKFYESKDLFKVKGTMDTEKLVRYLKEELKQHVVVVPPELVPYLKEKLKQDVEVVPPKKKGGGGEVNIGNINIFITNAGRKG